MRTLFNYSNYKDFLRDSLAEAPRGTLTRWATASGCQPSYLSQTLSREVQLTPDHAIRLGQHLGMNKLELDYWMGLVDHGRAASPELRLRIRDHLKRVKRKSENLGRRLNRDRAHVEKFHSTYYQNWTYAAVHVCTDIPGKRTPSQIGERLGLPVEVVVETLKTLEDQGLVRREGGEWFHTGKESHIERTSPHVVHHHQNWRQRATLDAQQTSKEGLHFTGTYAVSREAYHAIKEDLLKSIEQAHQKIADAKSETLINFNVDFYEV